MADNGIVAVAISHKPDILHRMAAGEPITAIARSLGYAGHSGITERLSNDPDYRAALQAGNFAKLEKREAELERATDNVSVTRADRLLGHARWFAGCVDPERWGQKQNNITINVLSVESALTNLASDLLAQVRGLPAVAQIEVATEAEGVSSAQQIGDAALLTGDLADYVKSDTE